MIAFLLNLLLAMMWVTVSGSSHWANFLVGFLVSYLALRWMWPLFGETTYFQRLKAAIGFAFFFLWELIKANLRVAYDVVTPSAKRRPAVVAVPLDLDNDAQITMLANLITLTPGTLSLDVSEDRKTLYIHAMFMENAETFRREIKEGFERRVREVMS